MTIHHIFANRSNAGDWLSARGIQRTLGPVAVIEHRCDTPFVEETRRALEGAGPTDLVVIGGGGLFLDYFTPFWRAFEPISCRVPFWLWGVRCCAGKNADTLPALGMLEAIVARSQQCILRDELTRAMFPRLALPPPVPCPSFVAVATSERAPSRQVLHVDHYDLVGPGVYERMESLIQAFATRTGRTHARCNNRIPDGDETSLQALVALYADSEIIVSSRLHGCILGLASGRRVIAVSGDHKIDAFMTAAGLSEWVCDVKEVERLPALLDRVHEQRFPHAFIAGARRMHHAIASPIRGLLARAS